MDLKNVKAITIPQGSVKKIEDSNGKIIWGSQDAFPYRRLEYIHFNGTNNYMNTTIKPVGGRNYAVYLKADSTQKSNARILGSYDNSVADAGRRVYLITDANNKSARWVLGATWSSWTAIPNYENKKIKIDMTITSDRKTAYCGVRDPDTNSVIINTTLKTDTAIGQSANLAIGTNLNNSGGIDANVMWAGNVYLMEVRNTNASGSIWCNFIPVQRKSDNKLGFINTVNKRFFALEGTQNSNNIGPTADEYWDLTDPFN